MSYTRNFGFRGFENIVREGRYRTPSSGTELEIGSPVVKDPATGRIAQAATGDSKALGGVLVYEHIQAPGFDPALFVSQDAHTAPLDAYAQVVHGPGVKIWLKNSATVTVLGGTAPAAGEFICPGATATAGQWIKAANEAAGWLLVESVSGTGATLSVEARFVF